MSWNVPENLVKPKAKVEQIKKKFEWLKDGTDASNQDIVSCMEKYQKGIIKALNDYGITSEYQEEVLTLIRKLK